MATNTDGDIIIGTKLDDSEFQSGLNKMAGIAAKGAAAVAAAIGAMSVAVISLGSEFESANAKASTLFGDAQVNMSDYSSKMLSLSTKTGLAASELGTTMYDALSAGIPATDDMSEAMGFLEKNTKLAKAGFTDINTATTATAKVLNAYKMDVSETDRIHKILMQTQNKGITTVNELGSVLSQVTPTASAMNVAFEQVGAALANMTAQGTPTAQATTQLNQLFAELGKSGTTGQEGMMKALEGSKHAGKGFSDLMKEGVPLNEILDLMATYADKNNLSMLDMFSSIEAGKAALSVSGQNSKQYTENLKAMGTEIDVVGEAYDKVTNTFEEKSKKAVNSLKNVGIAAYDKFKEPLSKAMDAAQKSIDSLSKSLSDGKMGKSVDKIAEGFGELIEVSVDLASSAIPLVIDGFGFVVDNSDLVVAALGAIGTAMIAYKAYNEVIAPVSNAWKAATLALEAHEAAHRLTLLASAGTAGGMTVLQTAVGVLTGKISLATAAQGLWNTVMSINPAVAAVTAIVALTGAVAALSLMHGEEKTKVQELNEAIDAQTESIKASKDAAKEKADAALTEIGSLQAMKGELDNIVDANGNVIAGFEDRASFLVNELAQATGLDIELVDGQIKNYGELSGAIDKTIEKMKAEAVMEAYKEDYTKALEEQKEAYKTLNSAKEEYNKVLSQEASYIKIATDSAMRNGQSQAEAAKTGTEAWQKHVDETKKALDDAQKNYSGYTSTIANYDQAKTDILNENFSTYKELLDAESSINENNLAKKREAMGNEIAETIANNETLASIRTEANAATVDAEIAQNNRLLLEKQLGLVALQNEVWAASPAYAEAYKALSEMGAAAFDANGNLTEEAQAKIDGARNGVMGWAVNYYSALQELADSGEKVYDENGNLTVAAQKKILDAKVKAEELSPQYVDALKKMADEGQSIYDQNGNLTAAAQKKMANAYAKINELSPNYKQALVNVAKDGQLTFDANGNLTDDAKKKVDDACKKIDEQQNSMKTTGKNLANKGKEGFEETKFNSAGLGAVSGIKSGAESGGIATFFGGLASKALNSFKNQLGIKSPSRAFRNLAKWIAPGIAEGVNDNSDIATKSIQSLSDDMLNSFDESALTNAIGKMDLAIASEQLRMSADSRIQAEYTVGKAVAELKQENQTLKGVLNGELKATMIMDEREVGIILAPIVSEEIEFNT